MSLRTVEDVILDLPLMQERYRTYCLGPLPVPPYNGSLRSSRPPLLQMEGEPRPPSAPPDRSSRLAPIRIALAVASMREHMTDEGWQIMHGLEENGWGLAGHGLTYNCTDVAHILRAHGDLETILVQDKREWDLLPGDFRDPDAYFTGITCLRDRHDIFKLTILKDAQHRPLYHRESAEEIGCHAWVIYYHPSIVAALAPYVRPEHLIRTYHTIDPSIVPPFVPARERRSALLSGAVGRAYPLRSRLVQSIHRLRGVEYLKHPGYHRNGCATPAFLQKLSQYKVAICTSSIFGYALRKIIEATAVGCRVITDLPVDEIMPFIDDNLIRVSPSCSMGEILTAVRHAVSSFDEERQRQLALQAVLFYNYKSVCMHLSDDIDRLRIGYGSTEAGCTPAPDSGR